MMRTKLKLLKKRHGSDILLYILFIIFCAVAIHMYLKYWDTDHARIAKLDEAYWRIVK